MKQIAIIFLLISLQLTIQSQDLRFGLDLSPSYSWISNDENSIQNNSSNLGFKLRFSSEYYFRKRYAFTIGLGFSFNNGGQLIYAKGGNYLPYSALSDDLFNAPFFEVPQPLAPGVKIRYKIQYVEIPLGMKFRSNEFGFLTYFLEVPIITVHIKSKSVGEIVANPNSYLNNEDEMINLPAINIENQKITKDINTFGLSWGVGAGIEYALGPSTSLVSGIYYTKMFTDFIDDNGYSSTYNSENRIWTRTKEDSKAVIERLTLKIGIIF